MAASALPLDRLRQLLRELPPGARALLIAELERAVLRGDEVPGGDQLLQEVRAAVRNSPDNEPRIDGPVRAFFRPVEPFLTDAQSDRKIPGRIARAAIEPIWTWISRDLIPAQAQTYCDAVNQALAGGESDAPQALVRSFHELAASNIRAAMDAARRTTRQAENIRADRIPNALDDIKDVQTILSLREPLDQIASKLPGHPQSERRRARHVKSLLDSPLCARQGLQPYALILVAGRLSVPWH
jgi:hypothetical protein